MSYIDKIIKTLYDDCFSLFLFFISIIYSRSNENSISILITSFF